MFMKILYVFVYTRIISPEEDLATRIIFVKKKASTRISSHT